MQASRLSLWICVILQLPPVVAKSLPAIIFYEPKLVDVHAPMIKSGSNSNFHGYNPQFFIRRGQTQTLLYTPNGSRLLAFRVRATTTAICCLRQLLHKMSPPPIGKPSGATSEAVEHDPLYRSPFFLCDDKSRHAQRAAKLKQIERRMRQGDCHEVVLIQSANLRHLFAISRQEWMLMESTCYIGRTISYLELEGSKLQNYFKIPLDKFGK